jgi:hypothetical protein
LNPQMSQVAVLGSSAGVGEVERSGFLEGDFVI